VDSRFAGFGDDPIVDGQIECRGLLLETAGRRDGLLFILELFLIKKKKEIRNKNNEKEKEEKVRRERSA
jgi:hypothetical protein